MAQFEGSEGWSSNDAESLDDFGKMVPIGSLEPEAGEATDERPMYGSLVLDRYNRHHTLWKPLPIQTRIRARCDPHAEDIKALCKALWHARHQDDWHNDTELVPLHGTSMLRIKQVYIYSGMASLNVIRHTV